MKGPPEEFHWKMVREELLQSFPATAGDPERHNLELDRWAAHIVNLHNGLMAIKRRKPNAY